MGVEVVVVWWTGEVGVCAVLRRARIRFEESLVGEWKRVRTSGVLFFADIYMVNE